MPLYVIERRFAEQLHFSPELVREVDAANASADVRWIASFLSADKLKSYCLYEATSPDAIWAAAQAVGVPADVIVEVDRFDPATMR